MVWQTEHDDTLRGLWMDGVPIRDISRELGCSQSQVSLKVRELQLPWRYQVDTGRNTSYMQEEANKRNVSIKALRNQILKTVAAGRLVGAVLDDGL